MLRRLVQPVTAVQGDDRRKRAISFRLRQIAVHSIAGNVLRNFPRSREPLLQGTKWLRGTLKLNTL